jgi:hypothetical protein
MKCKDNKDEVVSFTDIIVHRVRRRARLGILGAAVGIRPGRARIHEQSGSASSERPAVRRARNQRPDTLTSIRCGTRNRVSTYWSAGSSLPRPCGDAQVQE